MQANELKKTEIWEKMGSDEVRRLLNQNKDACQEEIRFLDSQGFIVERMAFPKKYLNKYFLYRHLRELKLVPKCKHAESVLKKTE